MFNISDFELMKFIEDDVPYLDLTTSLQQVGDKKARMKFISREDITLSCTEEAKRVVELLGCKVIKFLRSGSRVKMVKLSLALKVSIALFIRLGGHHSFFWSTVQA